MQNDKFSMLTDFYEFTMSNSYMANGKKNQEAYFDVSFRKVPDNGGFAILCGVQQAAEQIKNLRFSHDDIEYLKSYGQFSPEFIEYLENFKFTGDIWCIPEGTPVFPNEPVLTVRAPIIQAQILETIILFNINHQSLIATKANRIVRAAKGRAIMEFGARRAQGSSAALYGSRAAYIGGCDSTSCVIAGKMFGIPLSGTMGHSFIQFFDNEYCAFKQYAQTYPDSCVLLIDTYSALESGLKNAVRIHNEVLVPMGKRLRGVRIDSGDITYLSKKIRIELDNNNMKDCKIIASSSLDEYIISDMLANDCKVDMFGVGESLITSKTEPVFSGVYKLAAVEDESGGTILPRIKISENVEKISLPGFKNLYRIFDAQSDKAIADLVTLHDEVIDNSKPYVLFHPRFTWKKKEISNFYTKKLLQPLFVRGEYVAEERSTSELRSYTAQQLDLLWDELKRLENPHKYYVDLSEKLWTLQHDMLSASAAKK